MIIDKIVLKFIADILYVKQALCYEEYEDIMEASIPSDLDTIVDKMLKEEYNVYKQGETYTQRIRGRVF